MTPFVCTLFFAWTNQRFRKGVGGRGLATNKPPKRAQKVLQKCVPLLLRGHRKKGTEKRLESLACERFPRANPFFETPTPFRNFWFFWASNFELPYLYLYLFYSCWRELELQVHLSVVCDYLFTSPGRRSAIALPLPLPVLFPQN